MHQVEKQMESYRRIQPQWGFRQFLKWSGLAFLAMGLGVSQALAANGKTILLVVASPNALSLGDAEIKAELDKLGYTVVIKEGNASTTADATGKDAVYFTTSIQSASVGTKFRDVTVPVIAGEANLYGEMQMTGPGDHVNNGHEPEGSTIKIVNPTHPLAAGLTGTVTILPAKGFIEWGIVGDGAIKIAANEGDPTKFAIFAYEKGAQMVGLKAPGKRLGLFLFDNTSKTMNADAWKLFDAGMAWATGLEVPTATQQQNADKTPADYSWSLADDVPQLRFAAVTAMVPAPDKSDRLFVSEMRSGKIYSFSTQPGSTEKKLLIDISSKVGSPSHITGIMGFAFHPEYAKAGSPHAGELFVLYNSKGDGKITLSRFTAAPGASTIEASSEVVLYQQTPKDIGCSLLVHVGGNLAFGPDGFLYSNMGDGCDDSPDKSKSGNVITTDLYAAIFRLDVDKKGGAISREPQRMPPGVSTKNYFVPLDNPFLNVPNARDEIFATGIRSPWGMHFDSKTGVGIFGDVGNADREEVDLLTKGANYQWSYMEGTIPMKKSWLGGNKPADFHGIETPPMHDWPHNGKMVTLSGCVVGGVVYRGTRYPELQGHYVFGENSFGEVYSMAFDGQHLSEKTTLVRGLGVHQDNAVAAFTEDNQGEIWVALFNPSAGAIKRLQRPGGNTTPAISLQQNRSAGLKLQSLGSGQLGLLLPGDANYAIEVRNAKGAEVWKGSGQGYYRISASAWPSGLLSITARSSFATYSARYLKNPSF